MMMMYLMIALCLILILPLLSYMLFFKNKMDMEKSSPFECGFEPSKSARKGFSLKFFLIAVLFLIFDVEIALIIPAPLTFNNTLLIYKMMMFLVFILILILGLIYEWKNGMLNWTK